MSLRDEFRKFIARGSSFDLAVGIVIGTAFTSVVNSLVKDVFMPPIGRLTAGIDFAELYVDLSGTEYESLSAATVPPHCRMTIPAEATRCPHCTSELAAAG